MRSSALPRSCTVPGCKHSSRAVCICCNQYLCIDHLKDHSDKQINSQLTSLNAEINILSDRFHHISLAEPYFLTTLDKWRSDAYRTIDRFYETQRRHFEQFIQENRDKQHLQCNIRPLVIDENIATLRSDKITQDLLPLLRPYRTMIIIDDSYCWMASNEKYLLAHHKPNLYLLDRQLLNY
jgi:hypothetical protein